MNIIKHTKTQILFKAKLSDTEGDCINGARDYGQKVFHDKIKKGQTLYFDTWDIVKGYVNYKLY